MGIKCINKEAFKELMKLMDFRMMKALKEYKI